ncbi:hypothetical protein [Planctomycetes bacterium CA13]|uniref:hypothetical protein n=1 Tax=Novipirellula herctigrandis TaxID=2527986 RepID=UPI0011B3F42F
MIFNIKSVFLSATLLLGVMTPMVDAQTAADNSQRISELARQLEATRTELNTTRSQLQHLREQSAADSSQVTWHDSPEFTGLDQASQLSSFSESGSVVQAANAFACDSCPNCRTSVCSGVPELCDCCAEKLSWKKGKFRILPFGAVFAEAIGTNRSTQLRGSPLFLLPGPAPGIDDSRFTASAQQSIFGLNITGPDVGGFRTSANVAVNFFGEQPIQNNPGLFALLAYAELRNDDWRFWVGQDADAIGRQNTNSPAWSSHKMQGNVGQIRPGFRAERFFQCSDMIGSSLYFGLTQQAVNDFIADPVVAGIDNGLPNAEARWEVTLGPAEKGQRPLLFAIGGLIGETRAVDNLALSASNVSTSWAVIPELRMEWERWGFQGECFAGQAIGTYNGAIGQSLNPNDGEAIYSTGGFGEFFFHQSPSFTTSIGYGIDNPRDSDLGTIPPAGTVGQRARNEAYWLNFIWRLSEEWETRFEVSHLETTYIAPSNNSSTMLYHGLVKYSF